MRNMRVVVLLDRGGMMTTDIEPRIVPRSGQ